MSAPNTNLFGQLFVDYVKAKFFNNPDVAYSGDDILSMMPNFYAQKDMTSAAIDILLMNEDVLKAGIVSGVDTFKANPKAIISFHEKIDMDKKIKKYTKENLISQHTPLKYWPLISIGTIIFSAFGSYLVNELSKGHEQPSVINRILLQDSTQPQQGTQGRNDTSLPSQVDSIP